MRERHAKLSTDCFYHVYNRTVGKEKLFRTTGNYTFFLKKLNEHLSEYIVIYSYCLMPTHFHLLIKVKNEKEIKNVTEGNLEKIISKKFSNAFSSYTQSYNKIFRRHGTLFSKTFKRILIEDQKYLNKLVHYIHLNPVENNLCKTPQEWEFSSYEKIITDQNNTLHCEIIEWYGDIESFKKIHSSSEYYF